MLVQVTTANAGSWLPDTSLVGFDIRRQARTTRGGVNRERRVLVKRVGVLSHAHLAGVLQSVLGLKQESTVAAAIKSIGGNQPSTFDVISTVRDALPCALQHSC